MSVSTEALRQSPVLAGCGMVRAGKNADAIDGVKPRLVVEPEAAREVAALLGWASRERLAVVVRGGGTRLAWGRTPAPIDLLVCTRRLTRVLAHADADLTATVEAGATLEEFNTALARHRQWLPIDAPDGGTVGGSIATNESGPLRHRYGTPRDLLIGVQLATTDGKLVKAGGNVVKNVAGYDLGKLVSGSFGSLAAIVSATFKLLPVPASWQTLVATFQDREAAAHAIASLGESQLEPVAVEIVGPAPYRLLVRFATAPAATKAQTEQARALIGTGEIITGDAETAAWRRYRERASAWSGAVLRLSWLPAGLPEVLALIEQLAQPEGSVELMGRASGGAGLLRIEGDLEWMASVVRRLRARADLVRHVTLRYAPAELKERADVWGDLGHAGTLAGAVKRALDPMGVLNAGRGPI